MQRWSFAAGAAGLLLVGLALVGLLGGFKSDARRAQDTAGAFLSAFERHDRAAAEAQITRAARERGWIGELIAKPDDRQHTFTLGDSQVDGDDARVPITLTDRQRDTTPGTLQLRREDGAWKVRALTLTHDGLPFTLDFEHPENLLGDLGHAAGQAFGKAMEETARGIRAFVDGISQSATQTQRQIEANQRDLQRQLEANQRQLEAQQREFQRQLEAQQREMQRQIDEARRSAPR